MRRTHAQEDMVYAIGSFRIRQYFLGLDPAAVPFFPPTDPQGMTKLERIGVVATGPLQMLLTAAGMVGSINAIVAGMAVALVLRSLLDAPVPVAAVAGTLVGLGLAVACLAYQVRRFRGWQRSSPSCTRGQGPGLPGWPTG
jgi:hypothetical protein